MKKIKDFLKIDMKINVGITTTLFLFITTFFVLFGLSLMIKGNIGTNGRLINQTGYDVTLGSAFEGSNSTGRYALVEALGKYHSFFFNKSEALFSSPDVTVFKEKYFSLFTPGVAFLAVPFYIIGNYFGAPQLFSYGINLIFALLNLYLITVITRKLGLSKISSLISAFVFTFATNALVYSMTLTQHPGTATLILLGLLISMHKPSFLLDLVLGLAFGLAILFDIPNLFLFLPILAYVAVNHFEIFQKNNNYHISLSFSSLGIVLGVIPMILTFAFYNFMTTGSYTKIAQIIGRTEDINATQSAKLDDVRPKSSTEPKKLALNPRLQVNGLYILLFSNERSWLFYSPVVILGLVGIFIALSTESTHKKFIFSAVAVVITNIVIYSMFGDPWGGWSFGSRYLIPSAAIMCIFLAFAIEKYRKNILFLITFLFLCAYSLYISALGASTTIQIPPKVEAEALSEPIPYTFDYNFDLAKKDFSGSLIYNAFLRGKISMLNYLNLYVGSLFLFILSLTVINYFSYDPKLKN